VAAVTPRLLLHQQDLLRRQLRVHPSRHEGLGHASPRGPRGRTSGKLYRKAEGTPGTTDLITIMLPHLCQALFVNCLSPMSLSCEMIIAANLKIAEKKQYYKIWPLRFRTSSRGT
jgi:hypothetical protein